MTWVIAACIVAVFGAGAGAEVRRASPPGGDSEYTITVIPFYSPEKIWARFSPFIDYLRKATGAPWTLKLYQSHDALIDGLCRREVGFALLGPVPLGRAMDKCDVDIVAVAVDGDGVPFYHSFILTTDPAVSSLRSLRGRGFGLFAGSTAAHIYPLKMLRDAGLQEKDVVPVYYPSQDKIMNALLSREVTAAGVKETLYWKFRNEPLRVVSASEPLPNFAFAAAPGLRDDLKLTFRTVLSRLRPLANREDLHLMTAWDDEIKHGFIAPPPTFRAAVRKVFSVYEDVVREDR